MGTYVSLANVRAEGILDPPYGDDLVNDRISSVESLVELYSRTWFEARAKEYTLDGNGQVKILLPQPIVTITSVTVDGSALSASEYEVDPENDRILVRTEGYVWPEDSRNVVVSGTFGTVDSGGACPAPLKRAMIQWVIDLLPLLEDKDAELDRRTATATSIGTSGRTTSFQNTRAPWSGNPEVDRVIGLYRRPLGADV